MFPMNGSRGGPGGKPVGRLCLRSWRTTSTTSNRRRAPASAAAQAWNPGSFHMGSGSAANQSVQAAEAGAPSILAAPSLAQCPDGPPYLHGHWFVGCGLSALWVSHLQDLPCSESHLQTFGFGLALGEHHLRGHGVLGPLSRMMSVGWSSFSGLRSLG